MLETKLLAGVLNIHLDDVLLGGTGAVYRYFCDCAASVILLRKGQRNIGQCCGSLIMQDVIKQGITRALKLSNMCASRRENRGEGDGF